jgi:hypothetical protein
MHVLGQLQYTLALLPLSSDGHATRCLFVPPGGLYSRTVFEGQAEHGGGRVVEFE